MNGYWIIFIISIHAPPRGATGTENFSQVQQENFNSRPSARGDLYRRMHKARGVYFNSRPSARGDCVRAGRTAHCGDFNSRPSARGDLIPRLLPHDFRQFQFTPLREGRRVNQEGGCLPVYFNSRPSARGDEAIEDEKKALEISIHAPPRGATSAAEAGKQVVVFQFTPLREGRHSGNAGEHVQRIISIHAPPRGATPFGNLAGRPTLFQFTPLREGRRSGSG